MNWLRLHVSNLCNFKCPNCHVFELGENVLPSKVMAQEIFEKAIETFTMHMKYLGLQKTMVSLYGGETLANKKVIKNCIEKYGRSYNGIELVWVLNTNGSLLKEEDVVFFKEYDVEIHVSVDGREEIHNISRPTHKGKGTFHMVMPALALIQKHNAPAQINSYMMPSNYLHLQDIVNIANDYGIKKIYLDQFYNLEMITHKVGMEKYRQIYFYALVRGVQINGPWGRVITNYQYNKNKRERIHKSFCLDVNIDGSCYIPLHSGATKKMNLHLDTFNMFMQNKGWNHVVDLIRKTNDVNCEGCIIKEHCYGGAIEQVHYHIGEHADTKVSCDFFRDWVTFLNRPVYLKKNEKIQFISVINFEKANKLIEDIQNAVAILEEKLWPLRSRISVNICEYPEELMAASGQLNLPEWAVATTGISSALYHKGVKTTPALIHELTHLFLAQEKVLAPAWLIEGICEWVQETDFSPVNLLRGLLEKNLFELIKNPRDSHVILIEHDQEKPGRNLLYMQSQSFVEYVVGQMGQASFLSAIKNSRTSSLINLIEIGLNRPFERLIIEYQESIIKSLKGKMVF